MNSLQALSTYLLEKLTFFKEMKLVPIKGNHSGDVSAFSSADGSGEILPAVVPRVSTPLGELSVLGKKLKCVGRKNKGVTWGFTSMIGRRKEMEDTVRVVPGFLSCTCDHVRGCTAPCSTTSDEVSPVHFFGVYDGHGRSQIVFGAPLHIRLSSSAHALTHPYDPLSDFPKAILSPVETTEDFYVDAAIEVFAALQYLGYLWQEKKHIQTSFNEVNAERQQNVSRMNELQKQLSKLQVELERIQAEIKSITSAICALESIIKAQDSSRSSLFRQSIHLDEKIQELGNQQVAWELDQKVGNERLA
ncbi:hypothetical protein RND71_028418 [Anisodus tanguticus]|uniref:Uncharacterized protein n=1 Tax=Anisodus tanguticus TaxID=243964 RepID=A0AAE1VA15_9SOLA|nr:hypothetical protein RND71_028418 [Anisodus tanguticus]